MRLPTELQPASDDAFQPVPPTPQRSLSERLADPALPLSELHAAFDDALGGDWVNPDCPAGELLAELAARRRDAPDAESQAALQLHRLLFAALQARLPDETATQLRQLGGLYAEGLLRGWLPEVGYRLRMGALAQRFLLAAAEGPSRDGVLLPARSPWQARGAELAPHERPVARAVHHVGEVFAKQGRLAPADVPDIYTLRITEFPPGPAGEREFQRHVQRAEATFDLFATALNLPAACRDGAMDIIRTRAIAPEPVIQQAIGQLRTASPVTPSASTAPGPLPAAQLPGTSPATNVAVASTVPSAGDDGARAKLRALARDSEVLRFFRRPETDLAAFTALLVYAHGGVDPCPRKAQYDDLRASLTEAAQALGDLTPRITAGRQIKAALFELLHERLSPGSRRDGLFAELDRAQAKLDRGEHTYEEFQAAIQKLLNAFGTSELGRMSWNVVAREMQARQSLPARRAKALAETVALVRGPMEREVARLDGLLRDEQDPPAQEFDTLRATLRDAVLYLGDMPEPAAMVREWMHDLIERAVSEQRIAPTTARRILSVCDEHPTLPVEPVEPATPPVPLSAEQAGFVGDFTTLCKEQIEQKMDYYIEANRKRYAVDRSFSPTARTPYGTDASDAPALPDAPGVLLPIHRHAVATFTRLARERAMPAHFIEVGLAKLEEGRRSFQLLIEDSWERVQKW